jgi:lipoprotein-releasing system permease protein
MLGFQDYMTDRLVNSGGHIRVSAREKTVDRETVQPALYDENTLVVWRKAPSGRRDYSRIDHPAGWFELLNLDARVEGYSPQLSVQALAKRGALSASVNVIGVGPSRLARVTNLNDYIANGSLAEIGRSGNRLIVGKGLLGRLGSAVGENIFLAGAAGGEQSFRIVNTFELGIPQIDDATIYASLADVQKLNRSPSQISDILIRLTDASLAIPTAAEFAAFSPDKVQSWAEANQGILSVFDMQTTIRNVMSFCILLVAGFGIYNVLNMVVTQKRREIGILRSMGFTGKEISRLFLFQGLVFGTLGGFFGVVLGYAACRYLATLHIGVPGTVAYRNMLIAYDWPIYAKAFFLAAAASVLAGWIPARAAGKMNPIEIIRSEGG